MKLNSKGQLLLEMLIAIMVAAVIITAISNLFFVNIKEGQFTASRNDALMLAQEAVEAMQDIEESSWHNIYLPPMGNGSKNDKGDGFVYCLKNDSLSWFITGNIIDCEIAVNGKQYNRKIFIYNVNRDNGNISESSGTDDPSTQKIKVEMSYTDAKNVVIEKYFTRSKNKIMKQSGWQSEDPADQSGCEAVSGTWNATTSLCIANLENPANESGWNSYGEIESTNIDNSANSLKLK